MHNYSKHNKNQTDHHASLFEVVMCTKNLFNSRCIIYQNANCYKVTKI